MKKFYAVTTGDYSEYHIVTITENKENAERIAAAYDGLVEEYEDNITNPIGVWQVRYNEKEKMWYPCNVDRDWEKVKDMEPRYEQSWIFNCDNCWYTYVHAEDKEHALKIAQDKYSQWKAEREGIV